MKLASSPAGLHLVFNQMTNRATARRKRNCRGFPRRLRASTPFLAVSVALGLLTFTDSGWTKLTPEQAKSLAPAVQRQVSFGKDIRPILESSCTKCHGRGRTKGEFQLDTRETLLKGGTTGPAVVPGKSDESYL